MALNFRLRNFDCYSIVSPAKFVDPMQKFH